MTDTHLSIHTLLSHIITYMYLHMYDSCVRGEMSKTSLLSCCPPYFLVGCTQLLSSNFFFRNSMNVLDHAREQYCVNGWVCISLKLRDFIKEFSLQRIK